MMPEANPEREKRILRAASDLIVRYGYDKTTVDEIAREAGVSKGAIYLHFKSKEDLFEALILSESDVIAARYYALLDADPQGTTLYNIYRYGLVVMDESPLMKAIMTRDRRVLGDYLHRLRDTPAYGQAVFAGVEFVRHFQDAGLLRDDLDPEQVAFVLMALRYGVLMMDSYLPAGGALSAAQLGETLAKMLESGLAPPEGKRNEEAARKALEGMMDAKIGFVEQHRQQK
jgi:TetR/AcrR family acrAB operon transcriptional repressor